MATLWPVGVLALGLSTACTTGPSRHANPADATCSQSSIDYAAGTSAATPTEALALAVAQPASDLPGPTSSYRQSRVSASHIEFSRGGVTVSAYRVGGGWLATQITKCG